MPKVVMTLLPGRISASRIVLRYCYRDDSGFRRNAECAVSITWTPCHYGGERAWFIRPALRWAEELMKKIDERLAGSDGEVVCNRRSRSSLSE